MYRGRALSKNGIAVLRENTRRTRRGERSEMRGERERDEEGENRSHEVAGKLSVKGRRKRERAREQGK